MEPQHQLARDVRELLEGGKVLPIPEYGRWLDKIDNAQAALEETLGENAAEDSCRDMRATVLLAKAARQQGEKMFVRAVNTCSEALDSSTGALPGSARAVQALLARALARCSLGETAVAEPDFALAVHCGATDEAVAAARKAGQEARDSSLASQLAPSSAPANPGMIGPLCPGQRRDGLAPPPPYDAAFDANGGESDIDRAIALSLKEDHFSAPSGGGGSGAASGGEPPLFTLAEALERVSAAQEACPAEEEREGGGDGAEGAPSPPPPPPPGCVGVSWAELQPEQRAAAEALGWERASWEGGATPLKKWEALSAEEVSLTEAWLSNGALVV
jgi:hypothetical protein